MKTRNTFLLLSLLSLTLVLKAETWRSSLYPADWTPGYTDSEGRFLHDFSYAGYMKGEEEIPQTIGTMYADVTQAPYNADNTGTEDATVAIQNALDAVGKGGGGIVYMPEGTYKLKLRGNACLYMDRSNVILRGAGKNKTFIYNTSENMRDKKIIFMTGGGSWDESGGTKSYKINQDISPTPTTTIYLEDMGDLVVGDWIVIRSNRTQAWVEEHDMTGFWGYTGSQLTRFGTTFYRQITSVNADNKSIEIDIPTRYYMKTRDDARVYKISGMLTHVGLEDFSIGNKENTIANGWSDTDYTVNGTGAYQVHSAFLIKANGCQNSWLKNISSYNPGNIKNIHMGSNGLGFTHCRSMTMDNCEFSYPQYEGGGGNGYGYDICAQECLFLNCAARNTRHSYSFKYAYASGNVLYSFYSGDTPRLPSDFHMFLSMSNLIDNQVVDRDFIETNVRPYGAEEGNRHGHTSTQTLFWNTYGKEYKSGYNYIIDSRQYGYGYVIGTKGKATGVKTTPLTFNSTYGNVDSAPEDFVEGIATGMELEPASLYLDQLQRRLQHDVCMPAIASAHDGNFPAYAVDGDLNTRWSAEGKGHWIEICLGNEAADFSEIHIGFYNGDQRKSYFDIYYLDENNTWQEIRKNVESSGTTTGLETFTLNRTYSAKKIKIVGQGNNLNEWNSYTEIIVGEKPSSLRELKSEKNTLKIYPNPIRNNELTIVLPGKNISSAELLISDITGKNLITKKLDRAQELITINNINLKSGLYLANLQYNNKSESGIFIVE